MVAAAQAQAAHVAHAARYGYPSAYPTAMAPANNYSHLIHGQGTRKNATRESTQQLKLWLQEHQKNPYPTKAEKVYLALISGMTLTQVSTWFANARRRLKKENKWSPDGCDDNSEDGNQDSVSDSSQESTSRHTSVQPGQDDSGFSGSEKSDRDSGSPVVIPTQPPAMQLPNFHPIGGHMINHMMGHHPMTTVTIPTTQTTVPTRSSSPEKSPAAAEIPVPRFLPRSSPTTTPVQSRPARQARSVWSIADITGGDDADTVEDEVDVTA